MIIFAPVELQSIVNMTKYSDDDSDDFLMPTIAQAKVVKAMEGLEPVPYLPGDQETRRVCSVALDKNKHADLIELIDEIKNIKSCSMGKAMRELMYYGLIEVNRLKHEGKYNISLVDKA